jgi:hypothetical protein
VEGRRGGQPRRPPWGLAALTAAASWNWGRWRRADGEAQFSSALPSLRRPLGLRWVPQAPARAQRHRGGMMAAEWWGLCRRDGSSSDVLNSCWAICRPSKRPVGLRRHPRLCSPRSLWWLLGVGVRFWLWRRHLRRRSWRRHLCRRWSAPDRARDLRRRRPPRMCVSCLASVLLVACSEFRHWRRMGSALYFCDA